MLDFLVILVKVDSEGIPNIYMLIRNSILIIKYGVKITNIFQDSLAQGGVTHCGTPYLVQFGITECTMV